MHCPRGLRNWSGERGNSRRRRENSSARRGNWKGSSNKTQVTLRYICIRERERAESRRSEKIFLICIFQAQIFGVDDDSKGRTPSKSARILDHRVVDRGREREKRDRSPPKRAHSQERLETVQRGRELARQDRPSPRSASTSGDSV